MKRNILTPNNLFYQLKDMMNTVFNKLPDDKFMNKEVWSKETEDAFHNLQKCFYADLKKVNIS